MNVFNFISALKVKRISVFRNKQGEGKDGRDKKDGWD
jgi:hypothetical protein